MFSASPELCDVTSLQAGHGALGTWGGKQACARREGREVPADMHQTAPAKPQLTPCAGIEANSEPAEANL